MLARPQTASAPPAILSPMPTLSVMSSLTLSPVSTTSDNLNHRPFAGGMLSVSCDLPRRARSALARLDPPLYREGCDRGMAEHGARIFQSVGHPAISRRGP